MSLRRIPNCNSRSAHGVRVGKRRRAEFVEGSATGLWVYYVPGNRVANEEAESRGWLLYDKLSRASDDEPLRLVTWSWPSDRLQGNSRDFRVKASRSFDESYYLGHLLASLNSNAKVSLVGFSYGARIITGALHLAAGKPMAGMQLPNVDSQRELRARVVLMAAASHSYWLLPGELHEAALSQVDQLLVLYNPGDVALKHYHLTEDDGDPRALGYCGFHVAELGETAQHVWQLNVNGFVGRAHDELRYYRSHTVVDHLQRYSLWGDIGER